MLLGDLRHNMVQFGTTANRSEPLVSAIASDLVADRLRTFISSRVTSRARWTALIAGDAIGLQRLSLRQGLPVGLAQRKCKVRSEVSCGQGPRRYFISHSKQLHWHAGRLSPNMFPNPDNDHEADGLEGLIVPYGVKAPPRDAGRARRWRRWAHILAPLLVIAGLAAVSWVLWHVLQKIKLADVTAALGATSFFSVIGALVMVSLSYLCLACYDLLALNHLGKRLPLLAVAVGGFVAFALANTLGFVLFTAGGVRYRLYSPAGVTAPDVAVITIMSGLVFSLSATIILGVSLLISPQGASLVDGLPSWTNFSLGFLIVATLGGYVGWVSSGRKAIRLSGYEISLPGPVSTLAQMATGVGDMMCASAALYLLLPGDPGTGYPVFVGLFAAAITLGLLSWIPGGVLVFEGIMLLAVPNVPTEKMLASLLVFRVIYYLLPMFVAIGVYIWYEARQAPISAQIVHAFRMIGYGFAYAARWGRGLFSRIESEFRKRPRSF